MIYYPYGPFIRWLQMVVMVRDDNKTELFANSSSSARTQARLETLTSGARPSSARKLVNRLD